MLHECRVAAFLDFGENGAGCFANVTDRHDVRPVGAGLVIYATNVWWMPPRRKFASPGRTIGTGTQRQTLTRRFKCVAETVVWGLQGYSCALGDDESSTTEELMTAPASVQPLPLTVKAAASILAAYGTVVLLYAVVLQTMIGWNQAQEFPRAIIRFGGMALIAWGLLKRARWAWWFGILLPGFFLVGGLIALATFLTVAKDGGEGVDISFPPGFLPLAVFSAGALATAVALLLTSSSRATFRRPAA